MKLIHQMREMQSARLATERNEHIDGTSTHVQDADISGLNRGSC